LTACGFGGVYKGAFFECPLKKCPFNAHPSRTVERYPDPEGQAPGADLQALRWWRILPSSDPIRYEIVAHEVWVGVGEG